MADLRKAKRQGNHAIAIVRKMAKSGMPVGTTNALRKTMRKDLKNLAKISK